MKRAFALVAIVLLAALLVPGSAAAHLRLRSSTPARGDTVTTPLREVRVVFTQRVALRLTSLTLVDASGAVVADGAVPTDSSFTSFVLQLPVPLHRGNYTARWRTAGADGHVVEGSFSFFVVADDPALVAPVTAPTPHTEAIQEAASAARNRYVSIPWIVTRFVTFGSIVLAIGSLSFLLILAKAKNAAPLHDEFWSGSAERVRLLAISAGAVAFLMAVPRLLLQSAALHGDRLGLDAAFVSSLLDTSWGRGWTLQAGAALVFCLLSIMLHPTRRWVPWLLGAASMVLALSPGLSGHAAAVEGRPLLPIVLDTVHVFGASAWIGSLAALLMIALPLAMQLGDHAALAVTVATFSPVALLGAALAASTGVAGALFHISSAAQLTGTAYGQIVIIKFAAVVGVAALGAFNWRRVRPQLGAPPGSSTLQRSGTVEFAIAAVVLLITAVLVALPTP